MELPAEVDISRGELHSGHAVEPVRERPDGKLPSVQARGVREHNEVDGEQGIRVPDGGDCACAQAALLDRGGADRVCGPDVRQVEDGCERDHSVPEGERGSVM